MLKGQQVAEISPTFFKYSSITVKFELLSPMLTRSSFKGAVQRELTGVENSIN
jgi:hypothetical protein